MIFVFLTIALVLVFLFIVQLLLQKKHHRVLHVIALIVRILLITGAVLLFVAVVSYLFFGYGREGSVISLSVALYPLYAEMEKIVSDPECTVIIVRPSGREFKEQAEEVFDFPDVIAQAG